MPVRFETFELAVPYGVGGGLILEQCERAGLRPENDRDVFIPSDEASDLFRVSAVCHPCKWLEAMHRHREMGTPVEKLLCSDLSLVGEVVELIHDQFDVFVRNYLQKRPGTISDLFQGFPCDTRFRMEDMPWALMELLESFGVPEAMLKRMTSPSSPQRVRWTPHLRMQVLEAEREVCNLFDYY